ncbi:hypothetical protein [Comamonas sp. GB3 AK4-5]|uniref:hypothetical protein n=1 Tax=Comamonas sp. GB3 AK4-5 TaxID=3231487 RepID=UPI00351E8CBC
MAVQSDLRFSFTVGEVSFEVVEFTLHEDLSEAFPQYPNNPPRDWTNDIPAYNLARRLAPKVQWPADMDRESRTAP